MHEKHEKLLTRGMFGSVVPIIQYSPLLTLPAWGSQSHLLQFTAHAE